MWILDVGVVGLARISIVTNARDPGTVGKLVQLEDDVGGEAGDRPVAEAQVGEDGLPCGQRDIVYAGWGATMMVLSWADIRTSLSLDLPLITSSKLHGTEKRTRQSQKQKTKTKDALLHNGGRECAGAKAGHDSLVVIGESLSWQYMSSWDAIRM